MGGDHNNHLEEAFPSTQEFAVDLADLFEDRPDRAVVLQEFAHLLVVIEGNVVHPGAFAGPGNGKVVLGSVSWAVGTPATRLSTAFVALDERSPKDGIERR